MPILSIITAVSNGLAMNKIFLESLKKYTLNSYELIIIDNNSSDGTREYFQNNNAIVIKNNANYSYPYCQNQGIEVATGKYFVFLNNDVIVCPSWDDILINHSINFDLDILCAADNGQTGNKLLDRKFQKRWKRIKYSLYAIGKISRLSLWLMHQLMYGNWNKFCDQWNEKYKGEICEGLVGANIMMTQKGLNTVGWWDERIQAADFDLIYRIQERISLFNDIKPCCIIKSCFIHHYSRMTLKYCQKPAPFEDQSNLISLDAKWKNKKTSLIKEYSHYK
ncbi:glycosyltransferase family 2 protein [Rhizosphaericola mali]|uniref:Glycosyltransferase family 2 protein n=1 Tax=Rhizosphaericola mali TaxID=2545455 RepID=A0A5P2G4D4_9BACT|nr:glycosyltransferase [Rhizosphaericola mali]QES88682.1 glycosyltransferase family 2 protein [Rhizosphaericola mali]